MGLILFAPLSKVAGIKKTHMYLYLAGDSITVIGFVREK